jgi:hypothetical protein
MISPLSGMDVAAPMADPQIKINERKENEL